MHDPDVVLFEIRRPWPTIRRLRRKAKSGLSLPFARAFGFEAYWPSLITVWHCEPGGADSGTVCKEGRRWSSGLSRATVMFAVHHRYHLRLQVRPWQTMCRRIWTRCTECGQPFRRRQSVTSHSWNGGGPGWRKPETGVFHDKCSALVTWRNKAKERLWVLELVMDTGALSEKDVKVLAELRDTDSYNGHQGSNVAFRVFYDLKNDRKAKADA